MKDINPLQSSRKEVTRNKRRRRSSLSNLFRKVKKPKKNITDLSDVKLLKNKKPLTADEKKFNSIIKNSKISNTEKTKKFSDLFYNTNNSTLKGRICRAIQILLRPELRLLKAALSAKMEVDFLLAPLPTVAKVPLLENLKGESPDKLTPEELSIRKDVIDKEIAKIKTTTPPPEAEKIIASIVDDTKLSNAGKAKQLFSVFFFTDDYHVSTLR